MRLALGLMIVPLVGCSQILGIEDPSTGSGAGTDAAIDAPPLGDHLEFSVGNFAVAQQQRARFQVLLVHQSGQKEDVTGNPSLSVTTDSANGTLGQDDTARLFDGVTSGSAKLVATYPAALSASIIATVTAFTCHPVINELQTGAGNGKAADEFVEIYNPCTADISVAGWALAYRAFSNISADGTANDTFPALVTLAGTITRGTFRLYVGSAFSGTEITDGSWPVNMGLNDMGGALGLRDATGKLVDSVAYGDAMTGNVFIEGAPSLAPPPAGSVSRAPFDGRDDGIGAVDGNNSTNFAITTNTTPGAHNFP